ncbi:MAG: DUF2059 domain-containing protein [Desulfomicrobium sp.]|nr:DUF2059 domain-containing protein [Desulfomicrobium sp.]NLV96610.1 DUF2059 domain-containing protein [Desulfovibrionales bacterium]
MIKKIIFSLCIILTCSPAYSGEKEHRALARELIKITDGDTVMEKMKDQLSMVFEQLTLQMNIQQADKPKLDKFTARFQAILKDDMAWDKIENQYIDLYTTVFTEEDIKGLVGFYNSELGKKVTEKMPELMQQSMVVAREHMQTVVPKLEELTEEMRKEFVPQEDNAVEPTP